MSLTGRECEFRGFPNCSRSPWLHRLGRKPAKAENRRAALLDRSKPHPGHLQFLKSMS
jgi:hypothetical protein